MCKNVQGLIKDNLRLKLFKTLAREAAGVVHSFKKCQAFQCKDYKTAAVNLGLPDSKYSCSCSIQPNVGQEEESHVNSTSDVKQHEQDVHRRVTLSVESMLQHQAKRSQFLCVGEPGAILHPRRISWTLSADHQKHRTTSLVERFIYEIPLREGWRDKCTNLYKCAKYHFQIETHILQSVIRAFRIIIAECRISKTIVSF